MGNNTTTLNIGILAHVDAGKTTLTEQLLFQSGAIRSAGSVDKGTSSTDQLAVERERGISVRLATSALNHRGVKINLIDTPGHVDFGAEVEYALRAMDVVILVISALEGVQGHTISLFQAVATLSKPCVLFINKLDRTGVDIDQVMQDIHHHLSADALLLQKVKHVGGNDAAVCSLPLNDERIIESLLNHDDDLLGRYLEGEKISQAELSALLKQSMADFLLVSVVMGVAKKGVGIIELLDHVVDHCVQRAMHDESLSALAFKVEHQKNLGKLTYVRVFSGCIKVRDEMPLARDVSQKSQKVGQIKMIEQGKLCDTQAIFAGDIGVLVGLSTARVGDVFGQCGEIPDQVTLSSPLLTVQVTPADDKQIMAVVEALGELCDEDPSLDMQWLPRIRELHIKVTGMIQVEILQALIKDRYDLTVEFSEASVIYRETIAQVTHGYERYWMPKPCWAIVKFKIEPAALGSGVSYQSEVGVNDISAKYQKEIAETIDKALAQGIKGWQVTDVNITLVEGQDHNVHSRSGDFAIATPMAIMNGLLGAGTVLLEPILSFHIIAPVDLLGTITSDVIKMRGSYESPQITTEHFVLRGHVPAATSMNYPITLASISAGKAKFSAHLSSYQPCSDEQGKTIAYRGVSPLDRDKWILQARGAL